ncbi:MAG: hypothetical protein A2133_07355 [Actinobacteria bacterium RBG_16_64_13]|nr:MAG: hypothetical protein A2133_07355 [Actinobacteria bacterium RBG_16_64_13]
MVRRLVAIVAATAGALLLVAVAFAAPALADTIVWSENWDSYAVGTNVADVSGWKPWNNNPSLRGGITVSSTQSHSGPNSLSVYAPTDLGHVVHEFSGCDSGKWVFTYWQYVPSDFTDSTQTPDIDLFSVYSDSGPTEWSSDLYPDPNDDWFYGDTPVVSGHLPLITDRWVQVRVEIDLDNDTQKAYYDGSLLYEDDWAHSGTTAFAAFDLYALRAAFVYFDDFSLVRVTADNVAPNVNAGPDAVLPMKHGGMVFFQNGSFTDSGPDSWTGTVDYGDGTGVRALTLDPDKTFTLTHTYRKAGTYLVTVRVTDDDQGVGTDTVTVRTAHPPTVSLLGSMSLSEGSALSLSGRFTDSSSVSWTATVDYGDGSGVQPLVLTANKTFALDHVYADNGPYAVTVQVKDELGSIGTGTVCVTARNVAPEVNAGLDTTTTLSGGMAWFSRAGSFTDPGADSWTATVDYGDGSGVHTLALNPDKTFSLSHVFAKKGTYRVTVKVMDDDGGVSAGVITVRVRSAAKR